MYRAFSPSFWMLLPNPDLAVWAGICRAFGPVAFFEYRFMGSSGVRETAQVNSGYVLQEVRAVKIRIWRCLLRISAPFIILMVLPGSLEILNITPKAFPNNSLEF